MDAAALDSLNDLKTAGVNGGEATGKGDV